MKSNYRISYQLISVCSWSQRSLKKCASKSSHNIESSLPLDQRWRIRAFPTLVHSRGGSRGQGGTAFPSQRSASIAPILDILDENLVIICRFYVKNCIFVHTTDKNFPVTGPPSETPAPQSRGVEPPLFLALQIYCTSWDELNENELGHVQTWRRGCRAGRWRNWSRDDRRVGERGPSAPWSRLPGNCWVGKQSSSWSSDAALKHKGPRRQPRCQTLTPTHVTILVCMTSLPVYG